MGLFGKSKQPRMVVCPICSAEFSAKEPENHLGEHVEQISETSPAWLSEGRRNQALGRSTWQCACGPADQHWPARGTAMSGLIEHLHRVHRLDIGVYAM